MEPKQLIEYSEFTSADGMDLEVKGEVFDMPIKKTDGGMEFFTRVHIINCDTKEIVNELYFKRENDMDTLRLLVNGIKNDKKYIK